MRVIGKRNVTGVFAAVFLVNFVLFGLKLYIGLSSNSISIYSDGINNFFDGLSGVGAMLCFYFIGKRNDGFAKALSYKAEQLLSLVLSFIIFAVGFIFLYNSAERLMYPAPVWFTVSYFYLISFTAAVKLLMFLLLKKKAKATGSQVLEVMSLDSLSDFFITAVTVVTLLVSQRGGYSVDALGGIGISIFIVFTAFKNLKKVVSSLLGLPEKKKRELLEKILCDAGLGENYEIQYFICEEEKFYLKTSAEISPQVLEALKEKVYNETGSKLYIVK